MFLKGKKAGSQETAIGLDLGTSETKLVVLERRPDGLHLKNFSVLPSPAGIGQPGLETQAGAFLGQMLAGCKTTKRSVFVAANCSSAAICEAELPRMAFELEEVNGVLRLNSQRYLRRDLANSCLDACELRTGNDKASKSGPMRLLIAAAGRDEVLWYKNALAAAKVRPESLELTALTVVNALLASQPDLCKKEVVLLLDIGARLTSLNILRDGQPVLTRLMNFGMAQVTEYICQLLGISPQEAERQKCEMAERVAGLVEAQIQPFGRDVRASMDFFERQQECHITKALACGGMARSPVCLQILSGCVGMPFETWNPLQNVQTSELSEAQASLSHAIPVLAGAVGVAIARLMQD